MIADNLSGLSIQQPWAELILRGEKTMEIRSWRRPELKSVVLHASRTIDFPAAHLFGFRKPWTLPRGRLIALAEVVEVVELQREQASDFLALHLQVLPFASAMYGYRLANIRPLRRSIRVKGKPYPFPLLPSVAARIAGEFPDL